jgi:hypothetical protein
MIIYTYYELILLYLLVGVLIGFMIESLIRVTGNDLNGSERYSLIVLWPIMLVVFLYYFIKSLFNIDE